MAVLNLGDLVYKSTRSIPTLHSVGEWQFKMSIEHDPPTSLFGHIFIPIFGIHVIFAERTVEIVKLYAV